MLPCIVGSSATLTELIQQIRTAYKCAITGEALDELTVRAAVLEMAVRKAHSAKAGAGAMKCNMLMRHLRAYADTICKHAV